ncbi:MAG TPA: hypothetical protein PLL10_03380, partial [Elusimicrobiales bacterium]|nr:hypothetical protein [Elusimicrobiales bacterium]
MKDPRPAHQEHTDKLRYTAALGALCLLWLLLRHAMGPYSLRFPLLNLLPALTAGGVTLVSLPLLDEDR